MRLSDLQSKDVILVDDGSLLGNIIDAEVSSDGKIIKLVIYYKKGTIFSFKNKNEEYVRWNQIKKIGEDVILVDKNT